MNAIDCAMEEVSFAERVAPAYWANCRSFPDPERLSHWRPLASSLPGLINRLGTRIPALPQVDIRQTTVDGHRLLHWELGPQDGEPVVLLHGFGASKENWAFVLGRLAKRHRLLVPDIPGFGESDFIAGADYRAEAQELRLAQWLEHQQTGPVHIVGSSMGGALAALLSAFHPQLIRSLTLMNAAGVSGARPSPFEQSLLEGCNPLVPGSYSEVKQLLQLATHKRRQWLTWTLAPMMGRDMIHRQWVNHRLFHDLLHSEIEPHAFVAQVRQPTLILWGDQDRILDVSCADTFNRLMPGAHRHILPGVGHLPMLEAPRETCRVLTAFWGSRHHGQ